MHTDSPFYEYDPSSLGWLHRKLRKGEFITAADLARIGRADKAVFADPVYQAQVLLALANELPAAKSGRPPEGPEIRWITLMSRDYIKSRAAEIREKRKENRSDHLRDPRTQAAQEIVDCFALNITPEALHNRISRTKTSDLSMLSNWQSS